ncbi:mannonate dehydratase [Falsihalocynthiibacter sp. S25ZX9]|uniref:mannonate dehydratase n=1 Tax=Falsihalocynthiibacter sp. S25ZX9 TaxID=3240870 RepID=UPI00350FB3F8
MKQTWRWFGPKDCTLIEEIEQAGATGVVSGLHHVPNGEVWTRAEIEKRQAEIATRSDGTPSSLKWDVVESLPVSEDIKKQDGAWRAHLEAYKTSLENLAEAAIKTVCYNFMPILDWTRTDLAWRLDNTATCMRFDLIDFAAFDIFILDRADAASDFPAEVVEAATARHATMLDADKQALMANIVMGLPGANQELTFDDFKTLLGSYSDITSERLKSNQYTFLREVLPTAERLGMRLCCHPDDPPFSLLGLPRVMSTEQDYAELIAAVDSPANGITLCSGSLGVHPQNDLAGMMRRLGPHVHFLHLRNVQRESDMFPGSFYEAEHLGGSTDMVALIAAVLSEEKRRRAEGREDWNIPMRPDHGHEMVDDFKRPQQPGYPVTGRLRGLAELRGVIAALSSDFANVSTDARDNNA